MRYAQGLRMVVSEGALLKGSPTRQADDRRFVEECLDAYYERCPKIAVAVPEAMRLGEEESSGWSGWMATSTRPR